MCIRDRGWMNAAKTARTAGVQKVARQPEPQVQSRRPLTPKDRAKGGQSSITPQPTTTRPSGLKSRTPIRDKGQSATSPVSTEEALRLEVPPETKVSQYQSHPVTSSVMQSGQSCEGASPPRRLSLLAQAPPSPPLSHMLETSTTNSRFNLHVDDSISWDDDPSSVPADEATSKRTLSQLRELLRRVTRSEEIRVFHDHRIAVLFTFLLKMHGLTVESRTKTVREEVLKMKEFYLGQETVIETNSLRLLIAKALAELKLDPAHVTKKNFNRLLELIEPSLRQLVLTPDSIQDEELFSAFKSFFGEEDDASAMNAQFIGFLKTLGRLVKKYIERKTLKNNEQFHIRHFRDCVGLAHVVHRSMTRLTRNLRSREDFLATKLYARAWFASGDADRERIKSACRSGGPDVVLLCLSLKDNGSYESHVVSPEVAIADQLNHLLSDDGDPCTLMRAVAGHIVARLKDEAGASTNEGVARLGNLLTAKLFGEDVLRNEGYWTLNVG
eukprot:TRINITY_DN8066_c0_g1_i2.p1 TRINITY_DN8066_c0_g1~~TRINITY_DN8066_c0_g1_i2.p1  ORF type:complete len:518 (+),score=108.20 TRINITY_DN8066_c0_g1_i2:60-1556(+)